MTSTIVGVSRLTATTVAIRRSSRREKRARSDASRSRCSSRIGRADLGFVQLDDVRIPILGAGHGLDDIAGIHGVVVAVDADVFAVLGIGRQRRRSADLGPARVVHGLERDLAIDPARLVTLEELAVHLERARVLLLVDRVRRRPGGDVQAAQRHVDFVAGAGRSRCASFSNRIARRWPCSSAMATSGFMPSARAIPSSSAFTISSWFCR